MKKKRTFTTIYIKRDLLNKKKKQKNKRNSFYKLKNKNKRFKFITKKVKRKIPLIIILRTPFTKKYTCIFSCAYLFLALRFLFIIPYFTYVTCL